MQGLETLFLYTAEIFSPVETTLYMLNNLADFYFSNLTDTLFSIWHLEYTEPCTELCPVPVESEHAACDGHVHWHLSRHSANHKHLLPRVGVEGGVVDVLGSPELIFRQTRLRDTRSEKVKAGEMEIWSNLNLVFYIAFKAFLHILTNLRFFFSLACETNVSAPNMIN